MILLLYFQAFDVEVHGPVTLRRAKFFMPSGRGKVKVTMLPIVRGSPRLIVRLELMSTPVKLAVKSAPSAMVPLVQEAVSDQPPERPSHVPSAAWTDGRASRVLEVMQKKWRWLDLGFTVGFLRMIQSNAEHR